MTTRIRILTALLLAAGTCGPVTAGPPTAPLPRRGVVFLIGGVGGFDFFELSARYALPRAGVIHEIREVEWRHGFGQVLRDLQDIRHLLRKAEELAAAVRRVNAEAPGAPVFLVAKSGGTGLALAAAEQLPPASLERIILLSSAVSPGYDL